MLRKSRTLQLIASLGIIIIGTAVLITGCSEDSDLVGPPSQPSGSTIVSMIDSAGEMPEQPVDVGLEPAGKADTVRDEQWFCVSTHMKAGFDEPEYPCFDPNAEVLWPGSVLKGSSIADPTPERIPVKRGGGTVVINSINGTEVSSVPVGEANLASTYKASNEIIKNQPASFPARLSVDYSLVEASEEVAYNLRANASFWGLFCAKSEFGYDFSVSRTDCLVQIRQSFYTLMFQRPDRPNQFFAEAVTPEELAPHVGPGNPPVYVSSVTYGRVFYLMISASESAEKMTASVQATFFGNGGGGHYSSVGQLKDVRVQAFALGGKSDEVLKAVLGSIDETKGFLAGLRDAADITTGIPLSYSVRSVRSDKLVKNGDATEFSIKRCTPVGTVIVLNCNELKNLYPKHISGDRDFKGHGPRMTVGARLSVAADGRSVRRLVTLIAQEFPVGDGTFAMSSWIDTFLIAPAGYEIVAPPALEQTTVYLDHDYGIDKPTLSGSLIEDLATVGDIYGYDVGEAANGCRIVYIRFKPVTYTLKRV